METTIPTESERDYSRQEGIVPTSRIESQPVTIIGLGAGGRPLTFLLASAGVRRFRLIDFDTVEPSNCVTQSYDRSDIGRLKTEAVKKSLLRFDDSLEVDIVSGPWSSSHTMGTQGEVVFCCVDSMQSRASIYNRLCLQGNNNFFSEGRMRGIAYYVYSVIPELEKEYRNSLFPDAEAEPGRCTAQSTAFCGSAAAAQQVYQYVRYLDDKQVNLCVGGLLTDTTVQQ